MKNIINKGGVSSETPRIARPNEVSELPYIYEFGSRKYIIFLKEDEIAFLEEKHKREAI
ncbi:MAG: hypothetical protein QXP36_09010 [Conexivisphaerales archaeon]